MATSFSCILICNPPHRVVVRIKDTPCRVLGPQNTGRRGAATVEHPTCTPATRRQKPRRGRGRPAGRPLPWHCPTAASGNCQQRPPRLTRCCRTPRARAIAGAACLLPRRRGLQIPASTAAGPRKSNLRDCQSLLPLFRRGAAEGQGLTGASSSPPPAFRRRP